MSKVLLVEDNLPNQKMLARRLERRGYAIIVASDGAEGVAAAKEYQPDLILMDMSLPILSGWDATRQLKLDEATKKIPIIALTALAMVGDREHAMDAGCDDYDTKPVDMDRLIEKIDALLAKS